ncbi:hypothetical protein F2Q69_00032708 [Brassica cretica]|uniref:Uncharacterized protein n=1 Tax=Brassica cretica TaxID=69181 RepID=A0A8S9SNB3_BRACR|nr:hypothetical protein F2Q69_00032708 [Brassica cretica]
MIAATTTKASADCEAVVRENPVVKPTNVKRGGDLMEFDMLFLWNVNPSILIFFEIKSFNAGQITTESFSLVHKQVRMSRFDNLRSTPAIVVIVLRTIDPVKRDQQTVNRSSSYRKKVVLSGFKY